MSDGTVLAWCPCGGSIDAADADSYEVVCAGEPDFDSYWHRSCYERARAGFTDHGETE